MKAHMKHPLYLAECDFRRDCETKFKVYIYIQFWIIIAENIGQYNIRKRCIQQWTK